MANANFYLCDVCGAKTQQRLDVFTGREMECSGSYEDVSECVDLCAEHLKEALLCVMMSAHRPKMDWGMGEKLLAYVAYMARNKLHSTPNPVKE